MCKIAGQAEGWQNATQVCTKKAKGRYELMEFIDRQVELCLACMEYHMVYTVAIEGHICKYCYETDTLLQELTEGMSFSDLV